MERYLTWQLRFVSLKGYKCHIDIYKEASSAPAYVTQLTGTEKPFEYQETDNSDLLDFYRYKTGYIRIKEFTFGQYNDIYPTDVFDRYVRAYYGGTVDTSTTTWTGGNLVFTGYIQCQEFQNPWSACPRTIELPIISPLGLISNIKCLNLYLSEDVLSDQLIRYVYNMLEMLRADYKKIAFPGTSQYPWNSYIPAHIMAPLDDGFKHYQDRESIWATKYCDYLINGICAWHGWIVHDTPEFLVFQKIDYSGEYGYIPIESSTEEQPRIDVYLYEEKKAAITDDFEYHDNQAEQSIEMPIKKLTLTSDGGELTKQSLSNTWTHFNKFIDYNPAGSNVAPNKLWASLENYDPRVTADHMVVDSSNNSRGTFPCIYDFDKDSNIKYVFRNSADYPDNTKILGFVFNRVRVAQFLRFGLKISIGNNWDTIQSSDKKLYFSLKQDGKYAYIQQDSWYDPTVAISWYQDLHLNTVQLGKIEMLSNAFSRYSPIEFAIYNNGLDDDDIVEITELYLEDFGDDKKELVLSQVYGTEKILNGPRSVLSDEKSITLNFHDYKTMLCDHYIGVGDKSDGSIPQYAYMFKPQKFLKMKFVTINSLSQDALYYMDFNHIESDTDSNLYDVISESFNLRDDEHTIMLTKKPS